MIYDSKSPHNWVVQLLTQQNSQSLPGFPTCFCVVVWRLPRCPPFLQVIPPSCWWRRFDGEGSSDPSVAETWMMSRLSWEQLWIYHGWPSEKMSLVWRVSCWDWWFLLGWDLWDRWTWITTRVISRFLGGWMIFKKKKRQSLQDWLTPCWYRHMWGGKRPYSPKNIISNRFLVGGLVAIHTEKLGQPVKCGKIARPKKRIRQIPLWVALRDWLAFCSPT